jgi:hypothetical protein
MFMSEQKVNQAGRRGFLKLVTTGLPVAAVAATAGTQALASPESEIRQVSGLRKNDHYKTYLKTARF